MQKNKNQSKPDEKATLVAASSLQPAPYNPRIIDEDNYERLKNSVRRFGLVDPILVNGRTGLVVSGHQRLRAAIDIGIERVPIRHLDLSEDQERALNIALNNPALMGEYDDAKLAELLAGLPDDLQSLTGFDEKDISRLLDAAGAGADTGDDPDALPQEVEARSKAGEVYELGPHRLACGDCRNEALVGRLFGDELAGMIWTDPPYGIDLASVDADCNAAGYGRRSDGKAVLNDNLTPDATEDLIRQAFKTARCAPGASVYAAAGTSNMLANAICAFDRSGFTFKWHLVWVKDTAPFSRADYHFQHENILYGWKDDGSHYFTDDRMQTSVFSVPRPKASPEHPTMKPVELIESMIRNSSIRDQIVYDPFGGSGSTLIAADRLDRRAFLVELSPHYCDVIRARYERHASAAKATT